MKNTLLKVIGILMIIGGVLALILEIVALIGVGVASAMDASLTGVQLIAVILLLVSGIVELIAGIKGVSGSSDPVKGAKCLPWGIAIIVIQVIGQILNIVSGSGFSVVNFLIGLVLPVLYIIGAVNAKKAIG